MSSRYLRPLLLIAAVAAFIGGAVAIQRATIDRLLYNDAVMTGRNWTEYLAANIRDLRAIAVGAKPSAASEVFFEQGKKVGQVFLYKIFDAQGRINFISDQVLGGKLDPESASKFNEEAAEAVAEGEPIVEAKAGEPPNRPPFYAETYVPVLDNGEVSAVIETYIDQTAKRTEFEEAFFVAAIALSLLIALAFGIPAGAWYWRKREQERADARIHYLAHYDALTGLANRSMLATRLMHALEDLPKRERPLAVHCVDIDHFKDINDTFGLDAGDLLITIIAERLKAVIGSNDFVARLAGDEFAVVQMSAEGEADAEGFARNIATHMSLPASLKGHDIKPTVGIGIAIAPNHGNQPERLMKSAELALAKAKSDGQGHVRLFTADLDDELSARLQLERAINVALANDEFTVHFQPLYSASGKTLTGFEALARLPAAGGSFIPPSEFIPVAERLGLISQIGARVLEEACWAAASWPEHLTVSVNLSPAQFGKENIAEVVAGALTRSGLAPHRLQLEITESLLLHDSAGVMTELAKLKALGAHIVMDDFGTGYSSLSYLWRFPFDKIKIDQSFMRAFDAKDAPAEKIVRTIATLGHALGMHVCVEGVETGRHAEFATTLGCDEVQGYYFGRPAPLTDLAAIILEDFRREKKAGKAKPAARQAG